MHDFRDREIERLHAELYDARKALLDLMPDKARTLLSEWPDGISEREFDDWQRKTVAAITDLATPLPPTYFHEARAMCPLCGHGSSSFYTQGYALPGGLERHLVGEGNTYHCRITKHAFDLARGRLEKSFEAARAEEKRQEDERRRTERLFLIAPGEPPKLRDEGLWGREARTDEEFSLAEDRLREIGFSLTQNGNVASWRTNGPDYAVLADPRDRRRLAFLVWREGARGRRQKQERFHVLDRWTDPAGTFQRELNDALARLDASSRPSARRKQGGSPS